MRINYFLKQKFFQISLIATLLAILLVEIFFYSSLTIRLEYIYSDIWHRLAGKQSSSQYTALVMIDDPTLNERPDEPLTFWTPYFARAIETLRAVGVKIIALDFIFSASPERWLEKNGFMSNDVSRNYDQSFRKQINHGDVILAGYKIGHGNNINDFILPNPDYLVALPNLDLNRYVGLANLDADSDSIIRHFLALKVTTDYAKDEGMPRLSLGTLTAIHATAQDIQAKHWQFGQHIISDTQKIPIHYSGPPGTFQTISFRKLLTQDAQNDPEIRALKNKIVIIGSGYAGMNDVHPTPYTTSITSANTLMTGPEIQANIIETLMSGQFIHEIPALFRVLIFIIFLGIFAFIAQAFSAIRSVFIFLLAVLISNLAAYWLFRQHWLFPIAHFHIGLLIVLICLALMRFTNEERERIRIAHMFSRYVSPQVMNELLTSPELPELGGQNRQITVLFSDIRNFTTLSEKLSAREVVEFLNNYFERACAVLMAEGALIDKFIGDAIMCEFGAPLTQSDHALRAIRAALALHKTALEYRNWVIERFPGKELPEFNIGIGLHSGEAIVGNIGSATRMEYTAIGDTVNVASRLEGMTKICACPILASYDTVIAAGAQIRTGELYSFTVKGRHQIVQAYEILEVKTMSTTPD